jgi:signal transduction histidine kinase
VALEVTVPEDLPEVWVDQSRVSHVFGNLLSNALNHTPAGGRVTLTAEPIDGWVRFHVIDSGRGIPEAALARIFEPFFRVPGRPNETGAGLGLTIVKEIVEAHGGTVGVESREGRGTDVSFTLRRAGQPSQDEAGS